MSLSLVENSTGLEKLCSRAHGLFNDLLVDVVAQLHAVLQVRVVVRVCTARLNILIDCIDLRLVGNQPLFDLVQPIVNIALVELILFGVVFHAVVGDLLSKAILVPEHELFNNNEAFLFCFKVLSYLIGPCELV